MLGNVELYEAIDRMGDEIKRRDAENAKLRERITTQKQTIQSYRDESREWREAAEHAQAENAKLRELLQDYHLYEHEDCHSCRYINECRADESGRCIAPMRLGERYREIGVEVDR